MSTGPSARVPPLHIPHVKRKEVSFDVPKNAKNFANVTIIGNKILVVLFLLLEDFLAEGGGNRVPF